MIIPGHYWDGAIKHDPVWESDASGVQTLADLTRYIEKHLRELNIVAAIRKY